MIVAFQSSGIYPSMRRWLTDNGCDVVDYHDGEYDLGVSFLYLHKIPTEHVNTHTWINFHPAPLPELRGRNCAYRAIMSDMTEYGATLHYMDAGFDTGDIIECRRFPIMDTHCAGDLVRLANEMLAKMFYKYMRRFIAGERVPATEQPHKERYSARTPIDNMIHISEGQKKLIRALTVPGRYYANVDVDGVRYRIVPEAEYG